MGIVGQPLDLAAYLATPPSPALEQASFRRSVSTEYYALFHLLVIEAAQRWDGSTEARLSLERAFNHSDMKKISEAVSKGSWKGWRIPQEPISKELQDVAEAFVRLQEARHLADYANTKSWTSTEVEARLDDARAAFESWERIQSIPAAHEYLLALLIGKKRE
jgi:hypothetical protein